MYPLKFQPDQGLKLAVVRWSETTEYPVGPPEHWVVRSDGLVKFSGPKLFKRS